MNTGGDSSGLPFRVSAPTGVFAYGCPPTPQNPVVPLVPMPDVAPPMPPSLPNQPFDWSKLHPEINTLITCTKCNRHHRTSEPCPFCMRDEINVIKALLADKAKPAEEIAQLRGFLRKLLGALRDLHRVTASPLLAELITEGDLLLGVEPTSL